MDTKMLYVFVFLCLSSAVKAQYRIIREVEGNDNSPSSFTNRLMIDEPKPNPTDEAASAPQSEVPAEPNHASAVNESPSSLPNGLNENLPQQNTTVEVTTPNAKSMAIDEERTKMRRFHGHYSPFLNIYYKPTKERKQNIAQ